MMHEMIIDTGIVIAGMLLGVVFFGGLWYTVRKGITARHPALWFSVSIILRTAIVLVGFYMVADGQLWRLIACLAGFIIARFAVMRWTKKVAEKETTLTKQTSHGH